MQEPILKPVDQAERFLKVAGEFSLGDLPTEQPHPLTADLSRLSQEDLRAAFNRLRDVDLAALSRLCGEAEGIAEFAQAIADTFASGGRLFIAGCGATGRLALTVEMLCRSGVLPPELRESVIGFMAGGDIALIRSIEGFEDHPEYGARQLTELGFREGDLLAGVTEGGETPFVIGAVQTSIPLSTRAPWFCYCNPDDVLRRVATRSRETLDDPRIRKLNLTVGPMALAGSTRMQATTVQLAAMLIAIRHRDRPGMIGAELKRLMAAIERLNYAELAPLTEAESAIYQNGGHVLYSTREYGLTVLTDTTERAPTFSLAAFENLQDASLPKSLCYLMLAGSPDSASAWTALLGREPRTLEWQESRNITGRDWLLGYDISDHARAHRETRWGSSAHLFAIEDDSNSIRFVLDDRAIEIPMPDDAIQRNLCLKVLLNAHSTLMMGRLGRYEGNLMTWVKPSNNKLIDRAIRYVRELEYRQCGRRPDYSVVAHALFEAQVSLRPTEPIVLKTLERIRQKE
jgi:N-acetylmuramic acid 6-phosphate etherase